MVICTECGSENNSGSRYCSHCGEKLSNVPKEGSDVDVEPSPKNIWPVILPIAVFILIASVIGYTYNHSKQVNKSVLEDKNEAEELALNGKYKEAENLLVTAANQRPNYQALQTSLSSVRDVRKLDNELNQVEESIENNKLDTALENLASINNSMMKKEDRLVVTLTEKLNQLDSRITVNKINNQLKKLTSIDELAEKLNTLSGLDLEEATRVREKITEKIVSISTKNAEEAMKEKQFNEAIAAVDEGLQYVINHEKLAQLKDRVEQEKQAFEQEKLERIERAMEQAAEEDLKNRQDAVKILDVNVSEDEFGDITVKGEVQSEATKIVSSIEVTYDIINENDKVIESETAQVYPMYLNPEDKGTFEKNYYDFENKVTVKVTNVQWYVE
ncbi:zinc-ribbon domain-containing protein [Halobacillus seohaensis]|uniref:Zinc-ribbon domain-containing protein n=1 Tax=Halobacillus seohaensis TaxID=447421 RepID=A0ABW2EGG0_9BACI